MLLFTLGLGWGHPQIEFGDRDIDDMHGRKGYSLVKRIEWCAAEKERGMLMNLIL
jgi:hypothetical protein